MYILNAQELKVMEQSVWKDKEVTFRHIMTISYDDNFCTYTSTSPKLKVLKLLIINWLINVKFQEKESIYCQKHTTFKKKIKSSI